MLFFFSMYECFNLMKVKNINWFQRTIIKGGCSLIRNHSSHQSIPINHEKVLQELGGVDKTIAECIFDLVNTANLSGGLICPGNSLWFYNLMLKLSGVIGPTHRKLIKNHACIHDACGFSIKHFKIIPGHMYGLFQNNSVTMYSAGKERGYIYLTLSSLYWLGQLTGLRTTSKLMSSLYAPFFNSYDEMDEHEENVIF